MKVPDPALVGKDDPSRGVFEDVARWHNTVACTPTWEELLEVEYVRHRGEINMFSADLQRYCLDRGLHNAIEWYERCKQARIHPHQLYTSAAALYEKDHGPRSGWITKEIRSQFEERECTTREIELASRLRLIRKKKRTLKKGAPRR